MIEKYTGEINIKDGGKNLIIPREEEIINIIQNKDKEIEKLNKRVKECEEAYLRTRKQYSELEGKYILSENVITELEKWAKEELEQPNWASCGARCMLDKLQELKGSGKE